MVLPRNPTRRIERERGIALVGVLCILSLLTVLAVGALEATRRHGQLAYRSFDVVQASELADSAIRVAILEVTAPGTSVDSKSRKPMTVRLFGRSIAVQIGREAQRVDLNAADEAHMAAALAGKGMAAIEASTVAARILDWRDVDDEAGVQGAERAEYRRAGRSSGPRNGAFETVSELRQVLGTESLTDAMLDAFTVYSHAREAVDSTAEVSAGGPPANNTFAGEPVRLVACATVERTSVCRVAIVRFTGNRAQPVLVYSWSTRYGPTQ